MQHGLDPAALEVAADYAGANDSSCLVVVREGHLVFERYFMGTDATTPVKSWSVAKSYASALMGIAIGQGLIGGIDDSIAAYLPQFVGTAHEGVTLRTMLSMTTGMYEGLIADMADMFYAEDMTAMAVATPVTSEPGSEWHYSNVAVQLFEPILHVASGVEAHVFAEQELWSRIGMTATWMADPAGNPAMYMNVMASCRDHARFGHLYLNRGCWAGEQVVPEAWVAESTQPSQAFNAGYGYWWWLSGGTPTLDLIDATVLPSGSLHPFGPDDSFCADGLGSQTIEVIPSLDMVVVRMGRSPMEDIEGNPLPLFPILEMLDDGKMRTHNGVVQRVVEAVVD
ncbi:MAG: serine hydrolase [Myxococcota bacterium]